MGANFVGAETAGVEEIRLGGIFLRFLIDGPSSGAPVTMFEMSVEPGAKVPLPHHHEGFDEMGYGLSDLLRMTVSGKTFDLGARDSMFIPRGAVHGFENPHAETAKVLVVITPGVFGTPFFRDAILQRDGSACRGRWSAGSKGARCGDAEVWTGSGAGMNGAPIVESVD